jgi:hypothetical protein
MKLLLSLFVCFVFYTQPKAQSKWIKEAFCKLPAEKVFDLSLAARDSMLSGKTFYSADNTTEEIVAYNLCTSAVTMDYICVSLSFETAQRAEGLIEIRGFRKKNGQRLVLVSQTGGVRGVSYHQNGLYQFLYTNDGKLIQQSKVLLPRLDENILLRPGTPDSVKRKLRNNSNLHYDLHQMQISACLDADWLVNDPSIRRWLKDGCLYFVWQDDRFLKLPSN